MASIRFNTGRDNRRGSLFVLHTSLVRQPYETDLLQASGYPSDDLRKCLIEPVEAGFPT